MAKKTTKEDNTVIMSDKYISESGVQGGKIVAEKLVLGCLIIGIPLFAIGIFSLFYMLFVTGIPENWSPVLLILGPQSLAIIIGFLLVFSGYSIYRSKHSKK